MVRAGDGISYDVSYAGDSRYTDGDVAGRTEINGVRKHRTYQVRGRMAAREDHRPGVVRVNVDVLVTSDILESHDGQDDGCNLD